MFCLKNIWADRKAYRLEISGPELRPVREFLVLVQQPRLIQTGLSSLSDRSHVNEQKMYGGRYELVPV